MPPRTFRLRPSQPRDISLLLIDQHAPLLSDDMSREPLLCRLETSACAQRRKLRTQLAMQLNELIAERHFTQTRTAELLGIPQPHVSELKNYKLRRFSSERLLHFITLLDRDVEIVIRPKARGRASGLVSVSVM
jgi:predicted XRE-type DNA-binding protein